jgi:hypothetical protein
VFSSNSLSFLIFLSIYKPDNGSAFSHFNLAFSLI